MIVLDSGGVSLLSQRSRRILALVRSLRECDLWPPLVPTVVLVESLQGRAVDANTHRFLKTCILDDQVPVSRARRAAQLRRLARRGSAVDALVVATAEPGGTVLTGDLGDMEALAANANGVTIERC